MNIIVIKNQSSPCIQSIMTILRTYVLLIYYYYYFYITIIFIAITFFPTNKLFKLFRSIEFKHNKLQFGIRISSIEVSKQKLRISTAHFVYNKTYRKEIHPGATPFSRVKHWCLCSLPQQKSFPVSIGVCAAFLSRRASQ